LPRQLVKLLCRPLLHPGGVVDAGVNGHETGILHTACEVHGLPGHAQPVFDFGANGDIVKELPQGVSYIAVLFVPAVVADLPPQKACAYAHTYLSRGCFPWIAVVPHS